MRPPWIEATALLAAAGFTPATNLRPESPWRRLMTQSIDYAFLPRIDAVSKPTVVGNLARLAQLIDTRRHGQAIQLEEIEDIHARRRQASGTGPSAPVGMRDRGVQIWTLMMDGSRDRSLGFAWLRGGGREDLQRALMMAGLSSGLTSRAAAGRRRSLSLEALEGVMP